MSKHPISWHEECFKSSKRSEESYKLELKRAQDRYDDIVHRNRIYELQIKFAKLENLDGFDCEKYKKGLYNEK